MTPWRAGRAASAACRASATLPGRRRTRRGRCRRRSAAGRGPCLDTAAGQNHHQYDRNPSGSDSASGHGGIMTQNRRSYREGAGPLSRSRSASRTVPVDQTRPSLRITPAGRSISARRLDELVVVDDLDQPRPVVAADDDHARAGCLGKLNGLRRLLGPHDPRPAGRDQGQHSGGPDPAPDSPPAVVPSHRAEQLAEHRLASLPISHRIPPVPSPQPAHQAASRPSTAPGWPSTVPIWRSVHPKRCRISSMRTLASS